MRLADSIRSNVEPVLAEWEVFARGIKAGAGMDTSVTSTQAAGTTFTVRLPRHPAVQPGRPILDEPHIQTM